MKKPKEIDTANKKILIVDSDPSTCLLYKLNLENEGMKVKTASNSTDGVKFVDSFNPDLIMVGASVLNKSLAKKISKLKNSKSHKDLKVIALGN